jgi:predicted nucleotidyltransferase component of viral defense system
VEEIEGNPILTVHQKILLERFALWPQGSRFYLTGGTSLSAFYLRHRLSEDLVFFTEDEVEVEPVVAFLRSIPEVEDFSLERKFDRRIFLVRYKDGPSLRTEFTKYPFKTIKGFKRVGGIQIDSMIDILVNKLMAMSDRKDVKYYVDIYFILTEEPPGLSVDELILMAEEKFGIKGLRYILQGRFLEPPLETERLNMRKVCREKEVAAFFKELARSLIRKEIENEET